MDEIPSPYPRQLSADAAVLGLPPPRKRFFRRAVTHIAWPILRHQIEFNHATVNGFNELKNEINELKNEINELKNELTPLLAIVHRHESTLHDHSERLELAREQSFARHAEGIGLVRRDLGELALKLNEFRATYSMGVASILPKMAALELAFGHKPGAQPGGSVPQIEFTPELVSSTVTELDSFYAGLTEAFRGPEVLVRARLRDYVSDLETVHHLGPILDVGCGRGEMLEVMREVNFDAYGIDTNPLCVEACQQRGLTAELAEVRDHLASIPNSSLAAITAIHLVEHLPTEDLIEFINLAMVALKSGGILILETPNPENVLVSSLYFYLDPSHHHPLPPPLLEFILASRGVVDLDIRRLERNGAPVPSPAEGEPWFGDVKRMVDAFNARFACAPDYTVIARRP